MRELLRASECEECESGVMHRHDARASHTASLPAVSGNAVQLDLFGGSAVYGAPRVFALGMAEQQCRNCGDFAVPERGTDRTERAWQDARPDGEGWEAAAGYRASWVRTVASWVACCETQCEYCDRICDSEEVYLCSNCGDCCEECCDCMWCEGCEEQRSSERFRCGECQQCEQCCECCSECGNSQDYCECCSYCESPDCDCEEDCEDSEDCERVATYSSGLERSSGRTFGVELEIVGIGTRRAAAALAANGLSAYSAGYSHKVSTTDWKSVTDASVSGGCEAVSPILRGADGFSQLETATLALLANGADVDSQCGTHIHIGCEDLSAVQLAAVVKFYDSAHSVIDTLHPRSRRGRSQWSGPHSTESEHDAISGLEVCDSPETAKRQCASFPRYRSVNLTAFPKYGTVEFRQHAGSLNSRKLSAWIQFLFALISCAASGEHAADSLSGLLAQLERFGLSSEDSAYLAERAETLAA